MDFEITTCTPKNILTKTTEQDLTAYFLTIRKKTIGLHFKKSVNYKRELDFLEINDYVIKLFALCFFKRQVRHRLITNKTHSWMIKCENEKCFY